MPLPPKTILIGICGASCSGKTTLANKLAAILGIKQCVVLSQDNYYYGIGGTKPNSSRKYNFDRPGAFEMSLLYKHLFQLRKGISISQPIYDFTTHRRTSAVRDVDTRTIIIVEGLMLFQRKSLRELFDLKIFIDLPLDICLARRIQRDTNQRKRTPKMIIQQYFDSVRPMYFNHVLPGREKADLNIQEEDIAQSTKKIHSWIKTKLCEIEDRL